MVKRILSRLNGEVQGVYNAAYILAIFALLSAVLALVRDKLLAHTFGAGIELDLYYAAFRTPDLIYAVITSMVSMFVLVPFLTRLADDGQRRAFIHNILLVFGLLLMLVSATVALLTPMIVDYVFPNFVQRGYGEQLIMLTRLLLLQPILLGVSAIISSVVQYHGRYVVYAIAPLLYNFGLIGGVLFLAPQMGVLGLGFGVLVGAVLHLLVQVPVFAQLGYLTKVSLVNAWDALRVIPTSIIRTLALTANQVALFSLIVFAGRMPEGSIAIFTLALNLQSAPLAIIGASLSTAAFPTLARLYTRSDYQAFVDEVVYALRAILFWSLPVMALFIVLRAHIVRVIYGSGAFSWEDTRLTAAALALFIISLVAQGVLMLLTRSYYAAGKMKIPLIVNILTAGCTVLCAYTLSYIYVANELFRDAVNAGLRIADVGNAAVLMLPLAYTVASILGALIYLVIFFVQFKSGVYKFLSALSESAAGAFFVGVSAYATLALLDGVYNVDTLLGIFAHGALAGLVGGMTGFLILLIIGNAEAVALLQRVRRFILS